MLPSIMQPFARLLIAGAVVFVCAGACERRDVQRPATFKVLNVAWIDDVLHVEVQTDLPEGTTAYLEFRDKKYLDSAKSHTVKSTVKNSRLVADGFMTDNHLLRPGEYGLWINYDVFSIAFTGVPSVTIPERPSQRGTLAETPKISGSDITDADREQYGGVITISADALYRAYNANEVAADEKYKGKSVKITGKIQSIGKDILGSPYVIVGGSGMLDGVQCVFAKSETSPLASLSKGQTVTISGTVSGKMVQVIVSDCKLLNETWFPPRSKTQ